jgi:ribosomal protein S18 acetylase RimI-like enzyme
MPEIRPVTTDDDLAAVRRLVRAYLDELPFDLDFQDVDQELDALPGPYAPPEGALLLAVPDGRAVGTVGLRPLDPPGVCEMKRLYVEPDHRGAGIGRALAEAVLDAARRRGYHQMRLDTVASMTAARSLYRSLGFEPRPPYYDNPLDDVVYMERTL